MPYNGAVSCTQTRESSFKMSSHPPVLSSHFTRNGIANCCVSLLCCVIVSKLILLQFADASESCNPAGVASGILSAMNAVWVSLGTLAVFLLSKKAVVKTIALLIMGLYVFFSMLGLMSLFCGHESYADVPMHIILVLMTFAVVFIILHRKNIVLAVVYACLLMLLLMV